MTDTTLGTWARAATRAGGEDKHAAEKEEAVRLRKRIRELESEIDILKRFTAYWVKETGR